MSAAADSSLSRWYSTLLDMLSQRCRRSRAPTGPSRSSQSTPQRPAPAEQVELWAGLSATFDEQQLLDLLLLTGWYHAISYVARATRLPPEPNAPTFASITAGQLSISTA